MSAIDDKYYSLGGPLGFLGNPIDAELDFANGVHVRNFMNGFIAWSAGTGAFVVYGDIEKKWIQFDPQWRILGLPVTDELGTPDSHGRYNHFQRGSIYWTPETGAHEVHGAIRDKWASMGWECSLLGYPITDELGTPDSHGRYNHFQSGSIYWTPETGAHEVHGAIRDKWAGMGWERSQLGYPTSDEMDAPGGRCSHFQRGTIFWTPAGGAALQGSNLSDDYEGHPG